MGPTPALTSEAQVRAECHRVGAALHCEISGPLRALDIDGSEESRIPRDTQQHQAPELREHEGHDQADTKHKDRDL